MASKTLSEDSRGEWRFESIDSFSDTLGLIGSWVGPRIGTDKRNQEQREQFCLRRYLVGLKRKAKINFPVTVTHVSNENGPDFAIFEDDAEGYGLEVCEAGTEMWQAAMTEQDRNGEVILENEDSGNYPHALSTEIFKQIEKKINKGKNGRYRIFGQCDLLVYDNTGFIPLFPNDILDITNHLRKPTDFDLVFRRAHILIGETLCFDVFGNHRDIIDLSVDYDIDFSGWAVDQINAIKEAHGPGLDIPHLIEELEGMVKSEKRSFQSHLKRLTMHLLKWQFQPNKQTGSWKSSIESSRNDLSDLLSENPSFKNEGFLRAQLAKAYSRGRREAAAETGLSLETFPEECPYEIEMLLDEQFLPKPTKDHSA